MGQREGFSTGDIAKLNAMYHCYGKVAQGEAEEQPQTAELSNDEMPDMTDEHAADVSNGEPEPNRPFLPFLPLRPTNSNGGNRPILNLVDNVMGNIMRPFRPEQANGSNGPNRPVMNLLGNVMRPFRPEDANSRPNRPLMNLVGNIMRPFRPRGDEDEGEEQEKVSEMETNAI